MNEWSGWIVRQRGCVNASACSGLSDVYRIKNEGSLCLSVSLAVVPGVSWFVQGREPNYKPRNTNIVPHYLNVRAKICPQSHMKESTSDSLNSRSQR